MENSIDWRMFLYGHLFEYSCIYKWSIVALPLAPSPSYLFLEGMCYIFTAIILQGIYKHISQLFITSSSIKCNWNLHPGKSPQKMNIAYTWCRNAANNHAVNHATPSSPPPHPPPSESSAAIIPCDSHAQLFFSQLMNRFVCIASPFDNLPIDRDKADTAGFCPHANTPPLTCAPVALFPLFAPPPPAMHCMQLHPNFSNEL